MHIIQKLGLGLFVLALAIFTLALGLEEYQLTPSAVSTSKVFQQKEVLEVATQKGLLGKTYSSNFAFISDLKSVLKEAQKSLDVKAKNGLPEGVSEWDFRMGDGDVKNMLLNTTKASSIGPIAKNPGRYWLSTIGLGILGGIFFIIPSFIPLPGIKNNHIYHSPMTRGLTVNIRSLMLGLTIAGILLYGVFYMNQNLFWPIVTALIMGLIVWLVLFYEKQKVNTPARSASPDITGWLGIITGIYLIGFYILLYWSPAYITPWIIIADPVSRALSGNPASQWFLYGMLYTIVMLVMGVRMIAKYRHNNYQIIRTISVMFFQTAFAFIIPEILVKLNQPYYDFKSIWPLNYSFFFEWNLNNLLNGGNLGLFMLVWGIALALIGVPIITYFFGKRWYCSWVCGCGGLAETMGDPYRQLSDKSVRAWKYERWIIHAVLVFAVVMTLMTLYTYFTGTYQIFIFNSDTVRTWYGFLIGSAFAGIIGTGFYPLMGNRTWCRFGCPLAAYLGLVQRFKSRFRITTNGGQCISCGNCSTYCEMGIDVRHYAQRGQDIVRASCVGCGVCAAVCPRGVLRLENSALDVDTRTESLRAIHIGKDGEIQLMQ